MRKAVPIHNMLSIFIIIDNTMPEFNRSVFINPGLLHKMENGGLYYNGYYGEDYKSVR